METGEYAWQCLNICLEVRISERRTKKCMRISVLADCLFTVNIVCDEQIFCSNFKREFMIGPSLLQDVCYGGMAFSFKIIEVHIFG